MSMVLRIDDRDSARLLASEAVRLECDPEQLALAILRCVTKSAIVDAVLDGFNPSRVVSGRAAPLQMRIMKVLPSFMGSNGTILASVTDIERRIDADSRGAVRNALVALQRKGLLMLVEQGRQGVPARYRLTDKGADLVSRMVPCK